MANKSLFSSSQPIIPANTRNNAGGVAYARTPKQKLAQFAATGCLNSTFYANAEDQLKELVDIASLVEPEFVAKVALYARTKGYMKDVPAVLVAVLSVVSPGLMAEVFDRVIDTPKMLRNFVQIMRSGQVARRSLGTLPKRLVQQWLEARTDDQIFRASVGNAPSLADIVKMVHPKPSTPSRAALLAYLIGKPYDAEALPPLVSQYEAFKSKPSLFSASDLPDVPMEMLAGLSLTRKQWKALARKVSWQTLRMNLNTFMRHDVFDDAEAVSEAARTLRDKDKIMNAKVFPYQLMAAFTNAGSDTPRPIKHALEEAMETAIANVPTVNGKVWVFPDVSGSMKSPITGQRKGSSSSVRCIDVAALVAAAIVRKNPDAGVVPFSDSVVDVTINTRGAVMKNAEKLASLPSGGTNCSAPLAYLNAKELTGDLLIYVSDNESWLDGLGRNPLRGTATMEQWRVFKRRNPKAKLVCLDLQPSCTSQAAETEDVLNIGGFSDAVFNVISAFSKNTLDADHWVGVIEKETI